MAGRRREVVWSSNAERDVENVWDYLAFEVSADIADKMLREIGRACQALEGHSIAGRPRDELRIGMRSVLVHPYVIFFRTTDLSVEIVRILHQRRDIDAIFANDLDV